MEKYYFRINDKGIPQRCEFDYKITISSDECLLCENNQGHDFFEGWVKCICYDYFLENKILREKNEMLEKQIIDLLTNKYMEDSK